MKGQIIYSEALRLHRKLYNAKNSFSSRKSIQLYVQYFQLLKNASYSGNPDAQYDFAQQFENIGYLSIDNPNYNPKKCIYWYTKACSKNHAAACNNLAHFYEKGEGCKRNIKKALALYKKSGLLGYKIGENNYRILRKQIATK